MDLSTLDLAALDVVKSLAVGLAKKVVNEAIVKVVKEILVREKFPQPSTHLQRLAEPSMKSYINLYNDHRRVLKPERLLRVEQKLSDMHKYSQVIADHLKVLIVDRMNGITASQGSQLKIAIMQCLEKHVGANQNKPVPRFLETSYNFKCLKVVCADEESLQWLKEKVPPLKPWPGARLEVALMSKYSVYSTVSTKRKPKAMPNEGVGRLKFAIPNSSAATAAGGKAPVAANGANAPAGTSGTDPAAAAAAAAAEAAEFDEISKQIELHNTPMKVAGWKELRREDKGPYTIYFVSMENDCIEEIKKKGNRLFYKLGTIKVAPWNQNDELAYKKKRADELKQAALEKKANANANSTSTK